MTGSSEIRSLSGGMVDVLIWWFVQEVDVGWEGRRCR